MKLFPQFGRKLGQFCLMVGMLVGGAAHADTPEQAVDKLNRVTAMLSRDALQAVPAQSLAQSGLQGLRAELERRHLDASFLNPRMGLDSQLAQACERYPDLCEDGSLLTACVSGMAAPLHDPYVTYMNSGTFDVLMGRMTGSEQAGPGLTVVKDHVGDAVEVLEVLGHGPAVHTNIKAGDHIVAIDGQPTTAMNVEEARGKLQGSAGTLVAMTVQHRDNSTDKVEVTRAWLDTRTVETQVLQKGSAKVGYLRLRSFGSHSGEEMRKGLEQLRAEGVEALILDLRNNGGGLVTAAVNICSNFLPEGTRVVTVDRRVRNEVHAALGGTKVSLPLVVLVNHNSASAAEITAGAIHDLKLGTLVGTRSFGKGTVQRYFPLGDGSGLKFTTAMYRTPGGTCINGVGIAPDVTVDDPTSALGAAEDTQLTRGLEIAVGQLASSRRTLSSK